MGKVYTIVLDASFDLWQAGHDNDQESCDDFESAFCDAARIIEKQKGIEINVVMGSYDGPAMLEQTKTSEEGEIWQKCHDLLKQIDGEWYAVGPNDREAYEWAKANQCYTGTWTEWLVMDDDEREEYEQGAQGIPTI